MHQCTNQSIVDLAQACMDLQDSRAQASGRRVATRDGQGSVQMVAAAATHAAASCRNRCHRRAHRRRPPDCALHGGGGSGISPTRHLACTPDAPQQQQQLVHALTVNSRRMLVCSTFGSGRLMNLTATSRPVCRSLNCQVSPVPPWPAESCGKAEPAWHGTAAAAATQAAAVAVAAHRHCHALGRSRPAPPATVIT